MNSERMKELVRLFSKKNEILKKESQKNDDKVNESLYKSYSRMRELSSDKTNSHFKEDFSSNQARTVNSIIDQSYNNTAIAYQPVRQPLQAEEAFELSINRALNSGAPVKDMGFYDEVNWHLQSLGFPAKNALDIKNMILKMLSK